MRGDLELDTRTAEILREADAKRSAEVSDRQPMAPITVDAVFALVLTRRCVWWHAVGVSGAGSIPQRDWHPARGASRVARELLLLQWDPTRFNRGMMRKR
eukprot:3743697-Rhodomonas_salina.1